MKKFDWLILIPSGHLLCIAIKSMKKCEVLELMELQLARREREERRLRLDLDSAHQEINALKTSHMQIEAEV